MFWLRFVRKNVPVRLLDLVHKVVERVVQDELLLVLGVKLDERVPVQVALRVRLAEPARRGLLERVLARRLLLAVLAVRLDRAHHLLLVELHLLTRHEVLPSRTPTSTRVRAG